MGALDDLGAGAHGGVEAEAVVGAEEIFINGLGDAAEAHALVDEARGDTERVFAADGDEGVEAEAPAIWLIANAAEGSVRDGLSILDQAIAHADLDGGGKISADQVRTMLGLSDRTAIAQLMAAARNDPPSKAA